MAIREREKLRDLDMFFKPSFKCFKNEKINFIQAFPKQESLLFQNIFISFYQHRTNSRQRKVIVNFY
jgi:hypothetical protein